jgi:protein-L-isoaspartate(D-aspartate) O-methyltransferase
MEIGRNIKPLIIENCRKDCLEILIVIMWYADGREGYPAGAPYDAIHVGAAASEVPQALVDQLKPGGRMVIPVGDIFQELTVIDKAPDGSLKQWGATSVRYVPLTSRQSQLGHN